MTNDNKPSLIGKRVRIKISSDHDHGGKTGVVAGGGFLGFEYDVTLDGGYNALFHAKELTRIPKHAGDPHPQNEVNRKYWNTSTATLPNIYQMLRIQEYSIGKRKHAGEFDLDAEMAAVQEWFVW